MVGVVSESATLPPLREEVHCLTGPVQFDGSPSWTLHDPACNRFFRIGWAEFEMLARWAAGTPQGISEQVNAETTLNLGDTDVEHFAQFLLANNLLLVCGEQATQRLWRQIQVRKQNLGSWLLHNYLFFKIPLLKPDALLAWLYPRLAWIYSGWFAGLIVACAVVGLYFVSRQWEHFVNTFPHFFNWQGLSQCFLALIFSKILHECAHALTAHRYGCRVPTMGVAFMVMYPMLYTDASETWKLNARRQRLAVASAGIIAELGLAAVATLAWSFMSDGGMRSAVFLLASSTWIITLAINLSPFMRFDGYYLLADFMKIENLQHRAFAYNLWLLRRVLFGSDDAPPESVPPRIAHFFVIYAWGTWLYRLFLFLGIAWMVYQFFFKLLGIFLMAVEIGWFIVRPIWRELMHWPGLLATHRRWIRFALPMMAVTAGLFVPLRQSMELPALIKPERYTEIYLPYPARLQSLMIEKGAQVASGDMLAELTSDELAYQSRTSGQEADILSWQLSYQGLDAKLAKQRQIQLKQLDSAAAKQEGVQRKIEQLRMRSPLSGVVIDLNDQVQNGQWLKTGEAMMIIADTSSYLIEAYVNEDDIAKIVLGAEATFFPDNFELPPIPCHVSAIDDGSSTTVPPLLASRFGGPIAVRTDKDQFSIPEIAQYRVQFKIDPDFHPLSGLTMQLRGSLKLKISPTTFAGLIGRRWLVMGIRESGF